MFFLVFVLKERPRLSNYTFNKGVKKGEKEDLLEKITSAPRRLLKLEIPKIEIDEKACLTLFDPNAEWMFDKDSNYSKSRNSPWLGKTIKGKAVAVFNNSKSKIED